MGQLDTDSIFNHEWPSLQSHILAQMAGQPESVLFLF